MPQRTLADLWNYVGAVFTSVGYAAVILLLMKRNALAPLRRRLAAVGQMAFSNYLFQSVVTSVIFLGWGLGFAGQLDYAQQLLVVAAIWTCSWRSHRSGSPDIASARRSGSGDPSPTGGASRCAAARWARHRSTACLRARNVLIPTGCRLTHIPEFFAGTRSMKSEPRQSQPSVRGVFRVSDGYGDGDRTDMRSPDPAGSASQAPARRQHQPTMLSIA